MNMVADQKIKTWLPVVGYEDYYQVSDCGDIKNITTGRGRQKGKQLRLSKHKQGYMNIGLHVNGERKTFKVHRLVMLSFVGPCPAGMEVNHLDGNKSNNFLSNLEYVTPKENNIHADQVLHRPRAHGIEHGMAKLNELDILAIRQSRKSGISLGKLAQTYCVSKTQINRIAKHESWTHVQ